MSTITQEPLLKVEDAAARLNVSPSTVYRLTGRGELPTVRVGAQLRIDPDAVGRTTALDLGKGRQVLLGRGIEPAGPMRQTPLAHLMVQSCTRARGTSLTRDQHVAIAGTDPRPQVGTAAWTETDEGREMDRRDRKAALVRLSPALGSDPVRRQSGSSSSPTTCAAR